MLAISSEFKTEASAGSPPAGSAPTAAMASVETATVRPLTKVPFALADATVATAVKPAPVAQREPSEIDSMVRNLDAGKVVLIPAGVVIKGDIATDGNAAVVIHGQVEGRVSAGDMAVYVMDGGQVTGSISNKAEVVVAGRIAGGDQNAVCVMTPKRFVLAGTGHIEGDVEYGSVRIYEGGLIEGRMLPFKGAA